ncbi:MAG: hypothetical protein ABI444_03015 [Candidatus Kapaibacterium sp.]|jgi:hypothetical protein
MKRTNFLFLLAFAIVTTAAFLSWGCSSTQDIHKGAVKYDIAKIDTNHGLGYPYEFNRAFDLRKAKLFEPAAYVYINLYPKFKDSVVHQCIEMEDEVRAFDTNYSVPYYIRQSLATEGLQDPEIVNHKTMQVNKPALSVRYKWADGLLEDLYQYGIK